MTISMLLAVAALAAPTAGSKGPMGLRIDGLAPVRVTAGNPSLQQLLPTGDQSEGLSGLSNSDREKLRARLESVVRAELTQAGFDVKDASTDGVPLFVVFAESRMAETDRGPLILQTSVEVDEPGVWVRDPSRKGFIVVWKWPMVQQVPRKDVARTIESFALEGVRAFVSAQAQPTGGNK
jgi:hypothetical protein